MARVAQGKRLSPERRMSEILAAARVVYVAKGFGDLLIADVAKHAGVVEGSVYRYFGTKRDLLFSLAEDWLGELIEKNRSDLSNISGAWDQMRFFTNRHLVTFNNNPELSRLVFINLRPDPEYKSSKLFSLMKLYTDVFVKIVQSGIRKGELRSAISPLLVRDMVLGCLEHKTWSAYLRGEPDCNTERLTEEILEFLRRGLQIESKPQMLDESISRLESVVAQLKS